jgi:uncharacterized protein (TIGR03437 family)
MQKSLVIVSCLLTGLTLPGQTPIGNVVVTTPASFEVGLSRPGGISTLFCTGLQGIGGIVQAEAVPLPRSLAGVEVLIRGTAVPLLAVADLGSFQQINFQTPVENVSFFDRAAVVVQVRQGSRSADILVPYASTPADFFRDAAGRVLLLHGGDYALVTPAAPGTPGEVLVAYATGLGPVQPPVPSGHVAPREPLSTIIEGSGLRRYTILINEAPTNVLFAGLAPDFVGLYQLNFQVPLNAVEGDNTLRFQDEVCYTPFGQACGGQFPFTRSVSPPLMFPVSAPKMPVIIGR